MKVLLPWAKSIPVLLSLQAICQSAWVLLFDTSSYPLPHGLVTGRRPILLFSVFLASCPSFPIPKILFLGTKNTNSHNLSLPSPLLTQGGQYRYLKTGNSSHPGPSQLVGSEGRAVSMSVYLCKVGLAAPLWQRVGRHRAPGWACKRGKKAPKTKGMVLFIVEINMGSRLELVILQQAQKFLG